MRAELRPYGVQRGCGVSLSSANCDEYFGASIHATTDNEAKPGRAPVGERVRSMAIQSPVLGALARPDHLPPSPPARRRGYIDIPEDERATGGFALNPL